MFSRDPIARSSHSKITVNTSSSSLDSGSSSTFNSGANSYGACREAVDDRHKESRRGQRSESASGSSSNITSNSSNSNSNSNSITTVEIETDESYQNGVQVRDISGAICFTHQETASQRPLGKRHPTLVDGFDQIKISSKSALDNEEQRLRHNGEFIIGSGPGSQLGQQAGRFRYVVASLIVLGVLLSSYATSTMYIAAIEMVSNDVLQSGLTSLRAKHMSNDPLATNKNVALPGTCPVEAANHPVVALIWDTVGQKRPNASAISAYERYAMRVDTEALKLDIRQRLAKGQLVDWSIGQRSYIFTAHTLGAILLSVPVSRLGLAYGPKVMILVCLTLTSLRMLILPTIAGLAPFWATFLFELVIGGLGSNIFNLGYPTGAVWLLADEANFFVAISVVSTIIGAAATNFVSTQLLASGLDWSWCFYLPGSLMLALSLAWFVLSADRPEMSRFVSRAELELLRDNTMAKRNESRLAFNKSMANGDGVDDDDDELQQQETRLLAAKQHECRCHTELKRSACPANRMKRVPIWTTILTCPTVRALILVNFANHWTDKNSTLWPTFFSNILHMDSTTIGYMTGIKGVFALIFCTIFAMVTKNFIFHRPFNISLTAYRKWNQAIATALFTLSTALMIFMDCDMLANFIALLLLPIVSSFNSISHDQMPLDLSAEDSGLLVSVTRLVAIGDIASLPVASYILTYAQDALAGDRHTWRMVRAVGLATRLVGGLYFILVAKAEPKSYSRLEPSGPCRTLA